MGKNIIIKFSNGDKFSLDANIIAKMRTEYYSDVDGFEKGTPEWDAEFKQSLEDEELLDWIQNNIDWSDIEDDVVKINDADYDHEHEFYNSKFKIE